MTYQELILVFNCSTHCANCSGVGVWPVAPCLRAGIGVPNAMCRSMCAPSGDAIRVALMYASSGDPDETVAVDGAPRMERTMLSYVRGLASGHGSVGSGAAKYVDAMVLRAFVNSEKACGSARVAGMCVPTAIPLAGYAI